MGGGVQEGKQRAIRLDPGQDGGATGEGWRVHKGRNQRVLFGWQGQRRQLKQRWSLWLVPTQGGWGQHRYRGGPPEAPAPLHEHEGPGECRRLNLGPVHGTAFGAPHSGMWEGQLE